MEIFNPCGISKATSGTASPVGTASTVFNIPHGLGKVPTHAAVIPKNALSAALYFITTDSTNITVTYLAGITGTLSISWLAYI